MTLVGSWAGPRGRFMRFLVRVATDFDAFASSETLARFWVHAGVDACSAPLLLSSRRLHGVPAGVRPPRVLHGGRATPRVCQAGVRSPLPPESRRAPAKSGAARYRSGWHEPGAGRRSTQYSSARRRSVLPRYAQVSSADLRPQKIPAQRLWPREESNLRTRIRSPLLYPLSYGARRRSVARRSARPWTAPGSCARPAGPAAARGFARPRS